MKHLIIMAFLFLIVVGCSQQENGALTKPASQTATVQKTPTTLSFTKNGLGYIQFGKSTEELTKILTDNNVTFTKIGTYKIDITNAALNDVTLSKIVLEFKNNLLTDINVMTKPTTWETNLGVMEKLSKELTLLHGKSKPKEKPNKNAYTSYKRQMISTWSKGNIYVLASITEYPDGYDSWFDITGNVDNTPRPSASSSLTKAGKRVSTKHPSWDDATCNAVGAGSIDVGMTKEQVRAAWGRPQSINTTTNAYGSREQWVYGMKSYVYFEGNTCTTIQN